MHIPGNSLLLPTGPKPFQYTTEIRKIHNIPFSGNSLSFKLDYPEKSSFVAVVCSSLSHRICHFLISLHTVCRSATTAVLVPVAPSDQVTVLSSSDLLQFICVRRRPLVFYTMPSELAQCDSVQLYWNPPFVNGYVSINLFIILCHLTIPSITMCMAV